MFLDHAYHAGPSVKPLFARPLCAGKNPNIDSGPSTARVETTAGSSRLQDGTLIVGNSDNELSLDILEISIHSDDKTRQTRPQQTSTNKEGLGTRLAMDHQSGYYTRYLHNIQAATGNFPHFDYQVREQAESRELVWEVSVHVDGMVEGRGFGPSKRAATDHAARDYLLVNGFIMP
ncbi:hypothetical protein DL93DRAFT_2155752 [Clavulina sp. PMI_390]|nr:hypothetical protein DL93DRAFT_2155752 [Clavulina sp. PMI_390]